jgi:hypothetical protein
MELQHGRMGEKRSMPGRLKYFAGTALIVAGIMAGSGHDPVKDSSAKVEARPAASCAEVFTPSAESMLEGRVKAAVTQHKDDLAARIGTSGKAVVNFALGVDLGGNVHIQDAWTEPESGLSPKDIAGITGLRFDSITLVAPAEGNMCSYTLPVVLGRQG